LAGTSDTELVKGFLKGQRQAIDVLVETNYARVFSLACRVMKNEDEAKDITQDTFVRVFDRIGQFRFKSSLRTWILSITYNLCINRLNAFGNIVTMNMEHIAQQSEESVEEDERFLNEQKFEVIEKALTLLGPEDRLLLELFYLNECSIKEIALVLKRSETAAKTGLFRARQKLKTIVISNVNYEFN
jgi:RNA polymerase sigma factor (sigma-70 family)